MSSVTVGFIGLGNQGAPIARRIFDAGYPLNIWTRIPEEAEAFATPGAKVVESPKALGAACDVVGICVVNDDDVREVVLRDGEGVLYGMAPGGAIVIHSTVMPQTVRELAHIGRERGVHILDAPVSGGNGGAKAGTLTIFVGGDKAGVDRVMPILQTYGRNIRHLGPPGSGEMTKLLNNNLCFANLVMSIEALEIAERLGMDVEAVAAMLTSGSGMSGGLRIVTSPETLKKITGPTSNLAKDMHHFAEMLTLAGEGENQFTRIIAQAPARVNAYAKKRET